MKRCREKCKLGTSTRRDYLDYRSEILVIRTILIVLGRRYPSSLHMSQTFYDELAPYYHLLYGDWEASIARQAAALDRLLRGLGIHAGASVLDAACGIGTQVIGLAELGYAVTASDLSAGAVARLTREVAARGLTERVSAGVGDLRTLAGMPDGAYAAVLACDNSVPHLLDDGDILAAFRACRRCLAPGGVLVISVRDYAAIERRTPDVRPYGLHRTAEGRFLAVQVWEWDGDQYDLRLYLTEDRGGKECRTRVLQSRYYAVSIARLLMLLGAAGFVDVARNDDVLFQPVITGRRPRAA
jgi:SAM-dependent methyltransferase